MKHNFKHSIPLSTYLLMYYLCSIFICSILCSMYCLLTNILKKKADLLWTIKKKKISRPKLWATIPIDHFYSENLTNLDQIP